MTLSYYLNAVIAARCDGDILQKQLYSSLTKFYSNACGEESEMSYSEIMSESN
jgi:hypothetical protein